MRVLVVLLALLLGVAAIIVGNGLWGVQGAWLVGGVLVAVLFVQEAYHCNWTWTGFGQPTKTLWDWLQLFIIPAVLAVGGFWLSATQHQSDNAIALDQERESLLNTYMDRMSDLLLNDKLPQLQNSRSTLSKVVREIEQARTITAMRRLDGRRNGFLLTFVSRAGVGLRETDLSQIDLRGATASEANLSGAHLIDADLTEATLTRADLRGTDLTGGHLINANLNMADLRGATLTEADLRGAHLSMVYLNEAFLEYTHLSGAHLSGAHLINADLFDADLRGADLRGADLRGATLSEANLSDADLRGARIPPSLKHAKSLHHAIMPDGTVHP